MSIVYLNGKFIPEEQACVSVLDRGFIFGDGVYEVIPVYGGKLFRLQEHLDRLQNNFDAIRINSPHSYEEWEHILTELISKADDTELAVYLQVTRGVAKRDHAIPANITPTVFAMANPLKPPTKEQLADGISAITCDDFRWRNCHIKAISLLSNVLLRQMAVDENAIEAILVRNGEVTEGAASNLFIVFDGTLITPPKGPYLLPGITRDLILEIANENGIPSAEAIITEQQLNSADEIWITSSMKEIAPVTLLNNAPVGTGKPGPLWSKMVDLFQDFKKSLRAQAN